MLWYLLRAGPPRQTKVAASATMFLNEWERLGCLSYTLTNEMPSTWLDCNYESILKLGKRFEAWLTRNRQRLHQRAGEENLVTEVCCTEPDPEQSYATAATLLQKIGELVVEQYQLQTGS